MNLPVGKPVVIFLSSKDVIHSFGLPQMRVKQDAIPGIVQPVWFTPTQVGQIELSMFINKAGLQALGDNLYIETPASGTPINGQPNVDTWRSDPASKGEIALTKLRGTLVMLAAAARSSGGTIDIT